MYVFNVENRAMMLFQRYITLTVHRLPVMIKLLYSEAI